ncbi:unnamed protein product [Bursaphelenchus xylophilus]|uniref:receptor protein-tyrosine kinase n=1 Tax=Bursaphelenchus xylophilus TaxID=6326 RepID=A0A1I7RNH8_BURXY|nr:unnamed protein product [Bursaphelenchus xylophilus]CAG9124032.1 unnamed protein product [Bursaphelenchus xylophilus]
MTSSLPEEVEYIQKFLKNCSLSAAYESQDTKLVILNINDNSRDTCLVGDECTENMDEYIKDMNRLSVEPHKNYTFVKYFEQELKEDGCLQYSKVLLITNVRCLQLIQYPDFYDLIMDLDSELLKLMKQYNLPLHVMWINFDYLSPVDNRDCEMGHLSKPMGTMLSISHSRQNGTMLYDNIQACDKYTVELPTPMSPWLIAGLVLLGLMVILCIISCFILRYCNFPGKNKLLNLSFMMREKDDTYGNEYYTNFGFKKDKWEIHPGQLILNKSKVLGKGGFATVYQGNFCKDGSIKGSKSSTLQVWNKEDEKVAIKELNEEADDNSRAEFLNEINIMKRVYGHQHIIHLVGCVTDSISPILVLELCELGDLLNMLKGTNNALTQKDFLSIVWQIVDGMSYVASLSLIHRDLAARNILLSKPLTAKIGDFGLCIHSEQSATASSTRLPIKWTAIEALNGKFSEKSDIWSFGVLLYEIYSDGADPYPNIAAEVLSNQLEKGARPQVPEKTPENIIPIMTSCWENDPENRPKFQDIQKILTAILNNCQQAYGYIDFGQHDEEED